MNKDDCPAHPVAVLPSAGASTRGRASGHLPCSRMGAGQDVAVGSRGYTMCSDSVFRYAHLPGPRSETTLAAASRAPIPVFPIEIRPIWTCRGGLVAADDCMASFEWKSRGGESLKHSTHVAVGQDVRFEPVLCEHECRWLRPQGDAGRGKRVTVDTSLLELDAVPAVGLPPGTATALIYGHACNAGFDCLQQIHIRSKSADSDRPSRPVCPSRCFPITRYAICECASTIRCYSVSGVPA